MFPMGFWFHMGVSINGKTPSYHPFLDGDFPLQTIQLLGTPMTMETYQPLYTYHLFPHMFICL